MEMSDRYQWKVSTKLFSFVLMCSPSLCLAIESDQNSVLNEPTSQVSDVSVADSSSDKANEAVTTSTSADVDSSALPSSNSETLQKESLQETGSTAKTRITNKNSSTNGSSSIELEIKKQLSTGTAADPEKETTGSSFKDVLSSINPFSKKYKDDDKAPEEEFVLNSTNHNIEDLAYGEVLFDYYNDRNLDAIIRLRIAQDANQLESNVKHGELLLAQLYILQGLPYHADKVLETIDSEYLTDDTRTLILHQLARINMYQGNLNEARKLLENDGNDLSSELALGRDILLNKIYLQQEDSVSIKNVLAGIDSSLTRNFYSKYNLAMSGVFIEDEEFFLPILNELSSIQYWDLESRSLKDKALLTSAQYYLKKGELEKAKEQLNQVGYKGPNSIAALYHLGWIELEQEQYRDAFSLWANLSKRNPLNKYVGRSFLIRPYTLEKLGSESLALEGYFHAANLYSKLIDDIQTTIEAIESENWINQLKPNSLSSISIYETISDKPESVKTNGVEANLLNTLFSSDKFAITHQNFWEIELLRRNMERNKNKLAVFDVEYQIYDAEFEAIIPEAIDSLESNKNNQIISRIENVEAILSRIIKENDFLSAPNDEQAEILERISYLHDEFSTYSKGDNTQTQTQIQNRYLEKLQAIQAWDMSQDAAERQWQIREQYTQLIELLAETKAHYQHIKTGLENTKYKGIEKRISDLQGILPLRAQQLELLSLKNQQLLQEMALEMLEERKEEYKKLSINAKLAAARLQDIVVTGGQQ